MGSEGVEDQIRPTAKTSQNGRMKARSESQEKHRIALDGEDWYDVRHGRLIITPDGTAKEEDILAELCPSLDDGTHFGRLGIKPIVSL